MNSDIIKVVDEVWFRGEDLAMALAYRDTANAIKEHVDNADKTLLHSLVPRMVGRNANPKPHGVTLAMGQQVWVLLSDICLQTTSSQDIQEMGNR